MLWDIPYSTNINVIPGISGGLEVQKPTQALRSVKDPGNTFDLNPKWSGTLPSLIYLSWDIYRDPHSIKKNQISKLIFDT
jgi:hypothetical protein